jgi:hypothetical protein
VCVKNYASARPIKERYAKRIFGFLKHGTRGRLAYVQALCRFVKRSGAYECFNQPQMANTQLIDR